ncbi:MAG: anaerobic carbon-monoxide dehydrogenase catalytic subunit [Thermodesulfobacteriota bacterium]
MDRKHKKVGKISDDSDSLVKCREVNRRDFLKAAAAAGIVGVVLGSTDVLAQGKKKALARGHKAAPGGFGPEPVTAELIERAHKLGIDLVWDRESHCEVALAGQGGAAGLCCFRCQMGPCTLGEATGSERGACGATKDVVVARGLVRRVAGGAAAHVEHMRSVAKTLKGMATGKIKGYEITDKAKLDAIYAGLGCTGENKALAVAEESLADLGKDEGIPAWLQYKANSERKACWEKLGIMPTGAGAEISETCHRTNMGVDADMIHLATDALKLGLVDGYCGLHPATALQDVLFGTPKLVSSLANLTVIGADKINIVVHGHEPLLSEKIVEAAEKFLAPPQPINVVGICCTGNEILMRRGVPLAGSMVQQELAIVTGAIEAMVVDVQCIMPNIQRVARHFHTKVITTNPHARIEGATHVEFKPEEADEIAKKIVQMAVDNFAQRDHSKVMIPRIPPAKVMAGFSVEQIIAALAKVNPSDPLKPLIDAIAANNIRGITAIVGCVTPRDPYGYRHLVLTRRLLAENVLVVGTGCWAHVVGQRGLLEPNPDYPGVGAGLRAVLDAVAKANGLPALPPCWHMGSCVDNSRIEDVLNPVAAYLKVKISDLPVAASAPEFITEKAVAIGVWAVNLGVLTHIGGQPYISGSEKMVKLLTADVENLIGGRFYVETNPEKAAKEILVHINAKRQKLGLPV